MIDCARMQRTLLLVAAVLAAPASAGGLALVSNETSGTISLIDIDKDAVVGEINTGGKPRGAAVQQARKQIYVSEQASNSLLVIDIDKRAVVKKIELGESPEGVYISRDGTLVTASVELTNTVAFVDTARNEIAFRVKICAALGLSTRCFRPTAVSSTSVRKRTTSWK